MASYNSFLFLLLYFGGTFVLYSLLPKKYKYLALLAGSWFYYFISTRGNVWALAVTTAVVYGAALWMDAVKARFKKDKATLDKDQRKLRKAADRRKLSLIFGVSATLTVTLLLVTKYANFAVETVNGLFGTALANTRIAQPLGVSFYTLEAVSYLYDVKTDRVRATKNPLKLSLFLSFFLTVVEGPIARYDDLGVQLGEGARFDCDRFVRGAERVLWGLFKKVVLADRAAQYASLMFTDFQKYNGAMALLGVLLYTLQLYSEFSGIMDVVCGCGEMMGLTLPENFRQPFFSQSVGEFWSRWHMTLGAWLKEYVFYPLSLSKGFQKLSKKAGARLTPYYAGLAPASIAMFAVWFLCGFWHGAGWKYVAYGLYYYVLMMLGSYTEPLSKRVCDKLGIRRETSKWFHVFRVLRTFALVNLGMLIFNAAGLRKAFKMLAFIGTNFFRAVPGKVLLTDFNLRVPDYVVLALATAALIAVSVMRERGVDPRDRFARLPFVLRFVLLLFFTLLLIIIGAYGHDYGPVDLIYANF